MGVEIVTPTGANGTPAAGTGSLTPNADASNGTGGLHAVGPTNATPLPAVEKAGAAPDAVNDISPGTPTPVAGTPRADGKKSKPGFDKGDESSSKHKKKKGLSKVNPF
jgi:outer membrane protein assembly factor BamD